LAFRLAGAGMKVAVVERHLVGGTCVNTDCTPTKALPSLPSPASGGGLGWG
jgi:pyruvate/2-oxoglutarate dehydrogenase complex dihydrolipoamide dehydrogenase (E3) component